MNKEEEDTINLFTENILKVFSKKSVLVQRWSGEKLDKRVIARYIAINIYKLQHPELKKNPWFGKKLT